MSARKCSECGQPHLAGANGAIYCSGPLLRAVQLSGMYQDSKYFVDMTCRYAPERILADFQLFSSCKKNETSVKHLTNFVEGHFDQPGTELEYWNPPDWRGDPTFLLNIKEPEFKKFASDLNRIWKQLGRSMKDCVRTSPLLYSLVYVPNPFIVSCGGSTELYYWDNFWIVKGLLHSGMFQTARGIIDNHLYLVSRFKSVPCGTRIYYWSRSQPPFLVPMVKAYVDATGDTKYAVCALRLLEAEMESFMKDHAVEVEGRTLYCYRDKSTGPRPDAYREDTNSAAGFASNEEKEEHYANLKAASESGMEFSTRWFISSCGNNMGTLPNIKTTKIVPVELNCLLFRNLKTIAEFCVLCKDEQRARYHRNNACGLIKAISTVLWNPERGVWMDYDLLNKKQRDYFVVTNLAPLYFHAYPIADAESISKSVLSYIEEYQLDQFAGGVPHTLNNSGQQWDYPNVWPPMMYILIEGLNNLGTPEAIEMSKKWRERWVNSNYLAYKKTGYMYEKYNCEEYGCGRTNCRFANQSGFGWTNGILIEMLAKYGHELNLDQNAAASCVCTTAVKEPPTMENCPITSAVYLAPVKTKSESPCNADPSQMCGQTIYEMANKAPQSCCQEQPMPQYPNSVSALCPSSASAADTCPGPASDPSAAASDPCTPPALAPCPPPASDLSLGPCAPPCCQASIQYNPPVIVPAQDAASSIYSCECYLNSASVKQADQCCAEPTPSQPLPPSASMGRTQQQGYCDCGKPIVSEPQAESYSFKQTSHVRSVRSELPPCPICFPEFYQHSGQSAMPQPSCTSAGQQQSNAPRAVQASARSLLQTSVANTIPPDGLPCPICFPEYYRHAEPCPNAPSALTQASCRNASQQPSSAPLPSAPMSSAPLAVCSVALPQKKSNTMSCMDDRTSQADQSNKIHVPCGPAPDKDCKPEQPSCGPEKPIEQPSPPSKYFPLSDPNNNPSSSSPDGGCTCPSPSSAK